MKAFIVLLLVSLSTAIKPKNIGEFFQGFFYGSVQEVIKGRIDKCFMDSPKVIKDFKVLSEGISKKDYRNLMIPLKKLLIDGYGEISAC